jgi:hypothetical protein
LGGRLTFTGEAAAAAAAAATLLSAAATLLRRRFCFFCCLPLSLSQEPLVLFLFLLAGCFSISSLE